MAGDGKTFELSISPMAEKLFDENTQVRLQVTLEVGNWMLSYKDRYSFWHRMIPLLLTRYDVIVFVLGRCLHQDQPSIDLAVHWFRKSLTFSV